MKAYQRPDGVSLHEQRETQCSHYARDMEFLDDIRNRRRIDSRPDINREPTSNFALSLSVRQSSSSVYEVGSRTHVNKQISNITKERFLNDQFFGFSGSEAEYQSTRMKSPYSA